MTSILSLASIKYKSKHSVIVRRSLLRDANCAEGKEYEGGGAAAAVTTVVEGKRASAL